MRKSILVKNTMIILFTGFIVKIIGMIGKIVSTRILGLNGMSMYVLSYPTLLLFINISSFSLNNTISKLVSEAMSTKNSSPKKLLIDSIKISLIISFICIIIYLLTIKSISTILLKNNDLYFPLLIGTILIPFVGISDALRGYFNGLKKAKIASCSLLIEQSARTTFSIIGILIGMQFSLIVATSMLYIALTIGEIASIMYCIINLRKNPPENYEHTSGEKKLILKTSIGLTLTRLVGSISFFLEPIVYTFILTYLQFDVDEIHNMYTTIDAYVIPLLTIISFIPFSLSTAIIPHISESSAIKDYKKLKIYINNAYFYTIYPSAFCLIVITFYSSELMQLIFKSQTGALITSSIAILFIFYYIQVITSSMLQAIGAVKEILIISFVMNILRICLIFTLSLFPNINLLSIIYAIIITSMVSSLIQFTLLKLRTRFICSFTAVLTFILINILTFCSFIILNYFNFNYFLSIIIIGVLYLNLLILKIRKKI